jgi:hypothetical protein
MRDLRVALVAGAALLQAGATALAEEPTTAPGSPEPQLRWRPGSSNRAWHGPVRYRFVGRNIVQVLPPFDCDGADDRRCEVWIKMRGVVQDDMRPRDRSR